MGPGRRLAAIMFTDLEGYTAEAHEDEARALHLLEQQEVMLAPILSAHRGRTIKSMGDGLLLEFPNARDAVECAVALQQSVHERSSSEGGRPLRMRIGIHLGDVEDRGADILGDAVNIASRIEPLAEPGGVCLSAQVYDQVHNKVPYRLEALGPRLLKGVREPVPVYRVSLPWATPGRSERRPDVPRLAVLPLSNISPDPQDEYFADGLTEEIIAVTSRIHGLRVISRTSVTRYKSTAKTVAEIGAELGADSVLEGSVRKSGDRLRITVQLIDPRTDEHRWSETFDRKLDDVFAIQSEIAERTARTLQVELLQPELKTVRERPTKSLAAYEAYLRGIEKGQKWARGEGSNLEREIEECFERAIREDSEFSAAYARLALHLVFASGDYRPLEEVLPRARKLIERALELRHEPSEAHVALGELAWQVDHDWPRAEQEYQRALALNPSDSLVRFTFGSALTMLQRFPEAERQFLEGIELDPLASANRWGLSRAYLFEGNAEQAVSAAEKLVGLLPEYAGGRMCLARALWAAGRPGAAEAAIRPLATRPDLWSRANFAHGLALVGKPEPARAFLADWEAGRLSEPFPPRDAAVLLASLGEHERALSLLERLEAEGPGGISMVYLYPEFDPIRRDPRFVQLLAQEHLPTAAPRRAGVDQRPG